MTLRLIGIGGLGKMLGPSATHLQGTHVARYVRMYDRGTAGEFRDQCRAAWRQQETSLVSTFDELVGEGDFEGIVICAGKNGDDYKIIKEIVMLLNQKKKYFILHFSTVSCDFVRTTFQFCTQQGIHYVNYPLTGGEKGAASAKMLILASGDKILYERLLPMLQKIGMPNYFGEEIARAAAVKLIGHVLVFHGLLGISLAANLHKTIFNFNSLDAKQIEFFDFLNNGSGGTKQWDLVLRNALQNNNWQDGFLVKHAIVDVIYTAQFMKENCIPDYLILPLLEVALLFSLVLKQQGENELATQAIADFLARTPQKIVEEFIKQNLSFDLSIAMQNCMKVLPMDIQKSVMLEVSY